MGVDKYCFIAIDDDKEFNLITEYTIKNGNLNADVHTFLDPADGLDFIRNIPPDEGHDFIVLLDINMPTLSGWDVLDKIKTFSKDIQDRLRIFIMSSSINPSDKEMADNNLLVSGYIEKPLGRLLLQTIIG